jgi:hypothetical protein
MEKRDEGGGGKVLKTYPGHIIGQAKDQEIMIRRIYSLEDLILPSTIII